MKNSKVFSLFLLHFFSLGLAIGLLSERGHAQSKWKMRLTSVQAGEYVVEVDTKRPKQSALPVATMIIGGDPAPKNSAKAVKTLVEFVAVLTEKIELLKARWGIRGGVIDCDFKRLAKELDAPLAEVLEAFAKLEGDLLDSGANWQVAGIEHPCLLTMPAAAAAAATVADSAASKQTRRERLVRKRPAGSQLRPDDESDEDKSEEYGCFKVVSDQAAAAAILAKHEPIAGDASPGVLWAIEERAKEFGVRVEPLLDIAALCDCAKEVWRATLEVRNGRSVIVIEDATVVGNLRPGALCEVVDSRAERPYGGRTALVELMRLLPNILAQDARLTGLAGGEIQVSYPMRKAFDGRVWKFDNFEPALQFLSAGAPAGWHVVDPRMGQMPAAAAGSAAAAEGYDDMPQLEPVSDDDVF